MYASSRSRARLPETRSSGRCSERTSGSAALALAAALAAAGDRIRTAGSCSRVEVVVLCVWRGAARALWPVVAVARRCDAVPRRRRAAAPRFRVGDAAQRHVATPHAPWEQLAGGVAGVRGRTRRRARRSRSCSSRRVLLGVAAGARRSSSSPSRRSWRRRCSRSSRRAGATRPISRRATSPTRCRSGARSPASARPGSPRVAAGPKPDRARRARCSSSSRRGRCPDPRTLTFGASLGERADAAAPAAWLRAARGQRRRPLPLLVGVSSRRFRRRVGAVALPRAEAEPLAGHAAPRPTSGAPTSFVAVPDRGRPGSTWRASRGGSGPASACARFGDWLLVEGAGPFADARRGARAIRAGRRLRPALAAGSAPAARRGVARARGDVLRQASVG